MLRRSFEIQWVLANTVGSSVGFGVFAIFAHGMVSPHDEMHPSMPQVVAHTVGLLPAGAIMALTQKLALGRHIRLRHSFTLTMILAITLGFLLGAYGLQPPFDFLFAYAAAGTVLEFALHSSGKDRPRTGRHRPGVTPLLFAIGAFVGMLALSLVAKAFGLRLGEPGEDVVRHFVTMVLGGIFIGAAVGLLTARRITKDVLVDRAA
jgi:hypothetical protein